MSVELTSLLEQAKERAHGDDASEFATELVAALNTGTGLGRVRAQLGEILGAIGDPRLRSPYDDDYWVTVAGQAGDITIGRHQVTNAEFRAWRRSHTF